MFGVFNSDVAQNDNDYDYIIIITIYNALLKY